MSMLPLLKTAFYRSHFGHCEVYKTCLLRGGGGWVLLKAKNKRNTWMTFCRASWCGAGVSRRCPDSIDSERITHSKEEQSYT